MISDIFVIVETDLAEYLEKEQTSSSTDGKPVSKLKSEQILERRKIRPGRGHSVGLAR